MKRIRLIACTLVIIATMVCMSCNSDDNEAKVQVPESNIIEVATNTAELSTLVLALQQADLVSTFEGSELFTVMAPTNTAFTNFLGQKGYSTVEEVPVDSLRQLLLNHVVTTRVDATILTQLQKNYIKTLADGPSTDSKLSLYFDATSGVTFNGSSSVTQADILASNGLVHIVDKVIDLPTLNTFVSNDENLTDLQEALDIISTSNDLPSMLSNDFAGPFTIFGPVNQAFEELLSSNPDWSSVADIDETLLTSVLAHHAVLGNFQAFDLEGLATLNSLEGDEILVGQTSETTELTDGAGNSDISIIGTDVQAINGVIHLIDKVLLPDTEN